MNDKKRKREKRDAGRCTKQRSKKKYAKKRRWYGKSGNKLKQCIYPSAATLVESELSDVSKHKSSNINENDTPTSSKLVHVSPMVSSGEKIIGFRLIDVSILNDVFRLMACPDCFSTNSLELIDICERKKGLAKLSKLQCNSFLYSYEFYSSKQI